MQRRRPDKVRLRMLPGHGGPALAAEAAEAIRIRPGDRAVWVDLTLDNAQVHSWRAEAASAGVPVDAWLALQTEWSIVRRHLQQAGARVELQELLGAARTANTTALAPTYELRGWCRQLSGESAAAKQRDELPTVVVPERILAQLQPARRTDELIAYAASGLAREAAELDMAAACAGLTLEAWAYRAALHVPAA